MITSQYEEGCLKQWHPKDSDEGYKIDVSKSFIFFTLLTWLFYFRGVRRIFQGYDA